MTSRTAAILAVIGFLLTLGGVGGVENSITNTELLAALAVSLTGLALMYCSVQALKVSDYYDGRS
jgi:hypothetical protein